MIACSLRASPRNANPAQGFALLAKRIEAATGRARVWHAHGRVRSSANHTRCAARRVGARLRPRPNRYSRPLQICLVRVAHA
jgi:hypothetical protein